MSEKLSSINMTKILATVGPATNSREAIEDMVRSGVDGFRLNFSHGDLDERKQQITWIRDAAKDLGREVSILQDLQGPKIRLGSFEGEIEIATGSKITLSYGDVKADSTNLPVQYDISTKVKPGQQVYIFDGKIKTEVAAVEPGHVECNVIAGGIAMQKKGLNLPDTDFSGEIITEKDKKDISDGLGLDIDYVALSFVQKAQDIEDLRAMLREGGSEAKIVAKIETKLGVENLRSIVEASDAVMVARGDLAVEVSPEAVPIVQRKIISLCQDYGKISIVATQMLASMVDRPEPTRAEVSDVATAAMGGADVVMLSDETANGSFPIKSIEVMKNVIDYSLANEPVEPMMNKFEDHSVHSSISSAVITLSHQVKARAVVAQTRSGATALSISAHRPNMPLIAVTSAQRTANQLALVYGISPYVRPAGEKAGEKLTTWLVEQGILDVGDIIVSASGRYPGKVGYTDTIKVRILS